MTSETELLREVAISGVVFEHGQLDYVTVQIDTDTWLAIQRWRITQQDRRQRWARRRRHRVD